ncbi:MAG: sulfite exporter TauE/SafE family protein [Dethiosulfovibrio sp.]|nr:sulfite exporter TauE/SafE family protein [Dethiosulfovibrio sp.]
MSSLVLGGVAVFAGSVVQGCAGFAFSLVAAPFLLFFLPQEVVIPMLVLVSLGLNLMVLKDCGSSLDFKKVLPILAGGIISLPVGIWVLTAMDPRSFRLFVGGFIVLVSLVMLSGWRKPLPYRLWALLPIGLFSGVLNGSLSMSGPPVVLFLSNQGVDKDEFRANLAAYFLSLNLATIALYIYKGVLTGQVTLITLSYAPVLLIGTWLGIKASRLLPERVFRRMTLLLIAATGLVMIISNI